MAGKYFRDTAQDYKDDIGFYIIKFVKRGFVIDSLISLLDISLISLILPVHYNSRVMLAKPIITKE